MIDAQYIQAQWATLSLIAIIAIPLGIAWLVRKRNHRRDKKKINALLARGPLFAETNYQGVSGLVRIDDFTRSEARYEAAVGAGEIDPAQPIRFEVMPTFTFYHASEKPNFMHVGDSSMMDSILQRILERETGLTWKRIFTVTNWMGWDLITPANSGSIVKKTDYILVPHTSSGRKLEQERKNIRFTQEEVMEYLMYHGTLRAESAATE